MIRHNCGLCVTHTLHDVYSLIGALQHRGREATGIAAIGDDQIDVLKWEGSVDRFDVTDLHKIFPGHNYHTFMAHVRYATKGRKDKILQDAHPHVIGGKSIDRGNHVLITNCDLAGVHNGHVDDRYFKRIDRQQLKTTCDTEAFLHFFKEKGEYEVLKQIPGAYVLAVADKTRRDVIILRDKTGIKPGVLGWKDGKHGVASEDIAFRKNGGKFIEDLDPGCIYRLTPNGEFSKEEVVKSRLAYCFFEWNYLADLDSILNGISVSRLRETLGEVLAEEFQPGDAMLVSFLPRCPEVAARAYAKRRRIEFKPVFYKVRGERAFQGSTSDERAVSIKQNLHLLPGMEDSLAGSVLISIDDSTVRGNNSKRERQLVYVQGRVSKCYHVNYTPPIGITGEDGVDRGCLFGVDMAPDDNFIARGRTIDQISEVMQMPTVYISLEGMLNAFESLGMPRDRLCTYCIGGSHPFEK